jgi:hypothetical protein
VVAVYCDRGDENCDVEFIGQLKDYYDVQSCLLGCTAV